MLWHAMPPELNTARLMAGAGPAPMLQAAAGWEAVAAALETQAAELATSLASLKAVWTGASSDRAIAAAMPMVTWLQTAAQLAQKRGMQAAAQAAAYVKALAMTPSLPEIAVNHITHTVLTATNFFGINTMLMLVIVRHTAAVVAGLGIAVVFIAATAGGGFIATVLTPAIVRRVGRFAAANMALAAAAGIQLAGAGLVLPVMLVCGFLLGAAGQVVKLCADTAMQIDTPDPLRGHVFAVQDALFWLSFVGATAVTAALIPADGHSPALALAGAGVYLAGLVLHTVVGRRGPEDHRG